MAAHEPVLDPGPVRGVLRGGSRLGQVDPRSLMPWTDDAACKGQTALMYDDERQPEAATLCAACPVKGPCLTAGLQESFGIWGARPPGARRKVRARRRTADGARETVRRCAQCQGPFEWSKPGQPPATCGPECAARWARARKAAHDRRRRDSSKESRQLRHGVYSTYCGGCRCAACRSVAARYARDRRARAA